MEKIKTGRRSFLKTTAEVVGLSAVAGLRPANVAASGPAMPESFTTGGPAVIALDDKGVIETIYGKVRGSQRNGIQIFRGIPYGAETGGENRFMPAKEPTPWAGIRSTLWYGRTCPASWRPGGDEAMFIWQNDVGFMDEDCLVANSPDTDHFFLQLFKRVPARFTKFYRARRQGLIHSPDSSV